MAGEMEGVEEEAAEPNDMWMKMTRVGIDWRPVTDHCVGDASSARHLMQGNRDMKEEK